MAKRHKTVGLKATTPSALSTNPNCRTSSDIGNTFDVVAQSMLMVNDVIIEAMHFSVIALSTEKA